MDGRTYPLQNAAGLLLHRATDADEKYRSHAIFTENKNHPVFPSGEPEGAFATAHCKGSNCFSVNGMGREGCHSVFASVHLDRATIQAVLAQLNFMPRNVQFRVCVYGKVRCIIECLA